MTKFSVNTDSANSPTLDSSPYRPARQVINEAEIIARLRWYYATIDRLNKYAELEANDSSSKHEDIEMTVSFRDQLDDHMMTMGYISPAKWGHVKITAYGREKIKGFIEEINNSLPAA